ncbi:MAG: ROK family protein [Verrucomicrobiota bacterium]
MTPQDLAAALRPKHRPPLDPGFVPPALWLRAYRQAIKDRERDLLLAIEQPGHAYSVVESLQSYVRAEPTEHDTCDLYKAERMLKFALWAKGGSKVFLHAPDAMIEALQKLYAPQGARAFDAEFMGERVYLEEFAIESCDLMEVPALNLPQLTLGSHLDGCRIGFDLGGSDRKAAAVRDGEVVFSEEIPWNPYFQSDPAYHYEGIMDSLRRAAEHLPRVDAIGGSAAGVYVGNEPRVGSLFRGVAEADFADQVRPLFRRIGEEWGVPLTVVNDGDVTALAAAQMLGRRRRGGVLGLAFGTSLAAGYVAPEGYLTPWLNELAFVPVDYRTADEGGHMDEWSGDAGTGVRYLSQQALAQLAAPAGFDFGGMPLPEQLVAVQNAMAEGDPCARQIYESYGVYLGYTLEHLRHSYDFAHVLILGRVTSGPGGEIMLQKAKQVLAEEFPMTLTDLDFIVPDETFKRHGQSIAAASLPVLA